jgi:hypothetical protein
METVRRRRWVQPVILTSVLAAIAIGVCLVLFASCESTFSAPYAPPHAQVPGRWCSPAGDVLTLGPGSSFTVTRLSRRFAEDLLPAEGYIDDYRINTELGGTVPGTAVGTWQEIPARNDVDPDSPPDRGVWLHLQSVGTHPEHDWFTLTFDGDKDSWGFAVDRGDDTVRFFDRCQ